ncbi:hypothetical protein ABVT39_001078 [Epinephelus coioides]
MSTRRRRRKPVDDAKTYILSCTDKVGFMARFIDSYKEFQADRVMQVKALQTPAAAEETETSPVHQMFHEESKPDETNTQVKALQTPAAAEETETSPVHQMFHEESKPDETNTQVKALQTPAAAEETETSPVHQMFHEESKPDVTNTQVKALQTPAAAEETETSPVHQMFHEESKPDVTNTQVKALQTPAAAEETETSPVHQMFHEESKPDETNTQVKALQTPAAAEETETSPVHQIFHEESKPDETNTQVKALQTPAAAEETETSPVHQMFHEESKPDETNTQVFTVQGFSLIDYPDSDETDEDCMENESLTPHPDVVLRQNTENIMNDIGPDVSDHLYDDETVVKETCDEASQNNHSNEQSDDELVPPLRRTKSILMDRVQDFTHCLYDSSSDSAEDTFNLKPERDSQRLRRSSRCPRPLTQRDLYKRTLKMSVCQEKRGQKMWSACHPGTDVPPRYKFKTRKCLQMSVCQEKRGQKMKPACHPCKNVPPHHKSKTGVSLQKREENKVLSKEAGPQTSVLQWTDI